MKLIITGCCLIICLMAVHIETAEAQAVRIQQPIVQQFSVGTTLTVPDRGSALLGGIRSGSIHSRQSGPFRSGSRYGHSFQSSTSSVGVYIHDFEAMDQMLLNSAPRILRNSRNVPSAHHHWRNQLLNQTASSQPTGRSLSSSETNSNAREIRQSKAERFYELGKQAEKKTLHACDCDPALSECGKVWQHQSGSSFAGTDDHQRRTDLGPEAKRRRINQRSGSFFFRHKDSIGKMHLGIAFTTCVIKVDHIRIRRPDSSQSYASRAID